MSHLLLADYGLIGNEASVALVSRLGSIDWCCFPYLDSPSHFASVLDATQGGKFQIVPQGDFRSEQRYLQRTHILETVFETPHGRAVLTDWMPMEPDLRQQPVIFRLLEVIDGKIPWLMICAPRFDYGAKAALGETHRGGVLFRGPSKTLDLAQLGSNIPLEIAPDGALAEARFTLEEGQKAQWIWSWGRIAHLPSLQPTDIPLSPAQSIEHWRGWTHRCPEGGCASSGPWHDTVVRSSLVLKLLCNAHSGAIAEAATTSMPGVPGSSRTWDYRYAWVRDGAMAIQALAHLGCREESLSFFRWLSDIIARDGAEGLQPVYSLDGGKDLSEHELPFLGGHQGGRPVRVGNQSSQQFQLDVYGHIMIAAVEVYRMFGELPEGLWQRLEEIADYVCHAWRRPDHGPWETRLRSEHYVASKVMCWVALDRASWLAQAMGIPASSPWANEMRILHQTICSQGYDAEARCFVREFGGRDLDASAMVIPMYGFLPFDDPRVMSTFTALREVLSEGAILHRYRSPDGLPGSDGAHLLSSFLLVSCLALSGHVEEASSRLAELCSYATPLGLFGEQVDLNTGETTGNFPSAAVHLALINASLYVGAERGKNESHHGLRGQLIGMNDRNIELDLRKQERGGFILPSQL